MVFTSLIQINRDRNIGQTTRSILEKQAKSKRWIKIDGALILKDLFNLDTIEGVKSEETNKQLEIVSKANESKITVQQLVKTTNVPL